MYSRFFLGIGLGALLTFVIMQTFQEPVATADEECEKTEFVNAVACEPQIISKAEYSKLKGEVAEYISKKKTEGVVIEAGVYFRDLEKGPTMGVNEYIQFSTASLLKVPTLLTYLKLAETNPNLLQEEIFIEAGLQDALNQAVQYFPPPDSIVENQHYTIDRLLYRLIVYSDNIASEMLNQYLLSIQNNNIDYLLETYRELGLIPEKTDNEFVLSVKRYSSVFRILYNASYLSIDMSEKALDLLSQSTFNEGIVTGVPAGTKVAHKFGERTIPATETGSGEVKQLHDCGIVYFPENPYMLCIMTRGYEFEKLETVLGDISRMVYEEVNSRKIPQK